MQAAGLCSVAVVTYRMPWRIFTGEMLQYPLTEARERCRLATAGVNHFVWVTELRDRAIGEDLLPALRERVDSGTGGDLDNPRATAMLRETGYLLAPGDDYIRDFLSSPRLAMPMKRNRGTAAPTSARNAYNSCAGWGKASLDGKRSHKTRRGRSRCGFWPR